MTHMQTMTTDEQFQALAADPILCPNCGHGIDPHGIDPGGICGVGSVTEQGDIDHCPCLLSPNAIAHLLLAAEHDPSCDRMHLRTKGPTMTDPDLTPIKARLDAATPGPWAVVDDLAVTAAPEVGGDDSCLSIVIPAIVEFTPRAADAEFIAHAPTDIAALVAEVERLQEQLADVERGEAR